MAVLLTKGKHLSVPTINVKWSSPKSRFSELSLVSERDSPDRLSPNVTFRWLEVYLKSKAT